MRDEMEHSLEEEKRQEKFKFLQNQKQYAKNVIDVHKPTISKRKQEEMRLIVEELKKPPIEKINRIMLSEDRLKSFENKKKLRALNSSSPKLNDNLESKTDRAKQDINGSFNSGSQRNTELESVPEKSKHLSKGNRKDRSNSQLRKNLPTPKHRLAGYKEHEFIKHDYLSKERDKKMERGEYNYKEADFWREDIENPDKSPIDKFHEIKAKADRLERKAKMLESGIHGENSKQAAEEASSMYMDAIRAKAALLANL